MSMTPLDGRAARRRRRGMAGTGEVNLLPLMAVFLLLLPLLLVGAVFEQLTVIPMTLPSEGAAVTLSAAPRDGTDKAELELVIAEGHFELRAKAFPLQRLPRAKDASEAALQTALAAVKQRYPDDDGIVIVSPPTTRYGELIEVMDLARAAGWLGAALTGQTDL